MKKTKSNKPYKLDLPSDKEVEEMLEKWDIVTCHYCQKEISMLDAVSVNNGEYFICESHKDD